MEVNTYNDPTGRLLAWKTIADRYAAAPEFLSDGTLWPQLERSLADETDEDVLAVATPMMQRVRGTNATVPAAPTAPDVTRAAGSDSSSSSAGSNSSSASSSVAMNHTDDGTPYFQMVFDDVATDNTELLNVTESLFKSAGCSTVTQNQSENFVQGVCNGITVVGVPIERNLRVGCAKSTDAQCQGLHKLFMETLRYVVQLRLDDMLRRAAD